MELLAIDDFDDPIACYILNSHLYVLDNGFIKVYKLFVDGGLKYSLQDKTDFGINLSTATDISGFSYENRHFLYISVSGQKAIYQVEINETTGLIKNNNKEKITDYVDVNGQVKPLTGLTRIESSARTSTHNLLMGIDHRNNIAFSFRTDAFQEKPLFQLNAATYFPLSFSSSLTNIGYNIGENAFYVTDKKAAKIHVFNNEGYYMGSGGVFGKGEENNQLFYPNAISSNTLANDANEILVVNQWGESTGFKRIRPLAGVNFLEVVEKAPIFPEDAQLNELDFRFSLTAGYEVKEIKIQLNGNLIKTLDESNSVLLPSRYSNTFITKKGKQGIGDELVLGWNNYTVTIVSNINGSSLNHIDTKSIEFFYIPSYFDENYIISNDSVSGFYHTNSEPLEIYKSILVEAPSSKDSIVFTIKHGKLILEKGAVIEFGSNVVLNVLEEDIEFKCGAKIKLNSKKEVRKLFDQCHFNGLKENYNMVQTSGEYTGGKGKSGSASSSKLEFISCTFTNYLGKAVHIENGRVTFAGCSFKSTINNGAIVDPSLTAVGIFCSPGSRLDLRGSEFLDNDIAIDALQCDLFIGHSSKNYKGRTTSSTRFMNNTIGIHTTGGYLKVKHSLFEGNKVALLDLNGEIDIEKNSNNRFEENEIAIGFSSELKAWKGNNFFINNDNDLTYILSSTLLIKKEFDLTCNYWFHDGNEYEPLITITNEDDKGNNYSSLIDFDTEPYLIKKNKENYICNNSKSSNPKSKKDNKKNQPNAYNDKIVEVSDLLNNDKFAEADSKLKILEKEFDLNLKELGYYYINMPISKAYHSAVYKNTLLTYVQKKKKNRYKDEELYDKSITSLFVKNSFEAFPQKNYQTLITQDRLSFIDLLLNKNINRSKVVSMPETENKLMVINAFPNPFAKELQIYLYVKEEGFIKATLYNNLGNKISKIVNGYLKQGDYTFLVQTDNNSQGIYFIVVEHNKEIVKSIKLLKQ